MVRGHMLLWEDLDPALPSGCPLGLGDSVRAQLPVQSLVPLGEEAGPTLFPSVVSSDSWGEPGAWLLGVSQVWGSSPLMAM